MPEPTICWWYGIPYISDLYVWWYKYALYCKAVKNTQNVACTRAADVATNNDDFSFDAAVNKRGPMPRLTIGEGATGVAATLFSKDYGGRTVVRAEIDLPGKPQVELDLPRDSDGDFLPDAWENRVAVGDQRDGLADLEDAGGVHNEQGDGFTALEEYRGFQITDVAGTQVLRMDEIPAGGTSVKDVFVYHQSAVRPGAAGL